ncbi:hypothetical protein Trydic_g6567 [Trypoxylus dichotomus]
MEGHRRFHSSVGNGMLPVLKLTVYADDATIIVSSSKESIEDEANSMLEDLNVWFTMNKLFLNKTKIRYVTFTSSVSHSLPSLYFTIGKSTIDRRSRI